MSTENSNQPAFPIIGEAPGLTKREYFAAMFLQGILANSYKESDSGRWMEISTEHSIKLADTLLEQLSKSKQP